MREGDGHQVTGNGGCYQGGVRSDSPRRPHRTVTTDQADT